MHNGVAVTDVKVKLPERDRTVILEVFLNLHLYIMAREIAPELISIVAKFVGNSRK